MSIKISPLTYIFLIGIKAFMNLIPTREVADRLGVTIKRVQAMIRDGRLPAQKIGRDYVIKESDLALVADRKPGRPKKEVEEDKQVRTGSVKKSAAKKAKGGK